MRVTAPALLGKGEHAGDDSDMHAEKKSDTHEQGEGHGVDPLMTRGERVCRPACSGNGRI